MIFKYIIVSTGAILFNESTVHVQVAQGLGKVYGAGFVKLECIIHRIYNAEVYGESTSLGIKSNEKDQFIIEDLFRTVSFIKHLGFSVKEHYEDE